MVLLKELDVEIEQIKKYLFGGSPGKGIIAKFKDDGSKRQNAASHAVKNAVDMMPEDVAHLVCFLCSDRSRHITGEVIKIDGGQYI